MPAQQTCTKHLRSARFRGALTLLVSLGLGALGGYVAADTLSQPDGVPRLITYEGYLTQGGQPVADGTHSMWFRLYTSATATTHVWERAQPSVPTTGGHFAFTLGDTLMGQQALPSAAIDGGDLWLEIAVGTSTQVVGRQRVVSVPYALRAATASRAGTAQDVASGGPLDVRLDAVEAEQVVVAAQVAIGSAGSARTYPSGVETSMPFDVEGFDRSNSYDNLAYRFVVPDAGVYQVSANVEFFPRSASETILSAGLHVNVNGAYACSIGAMRNPGGPYGPVSGTCLVTCNVGDRIEVVGGAQTSAGAAYSLSQNAGLSLIRVGR